MITTLMPLLALAGRAPASTTPMTMHTILDSMRARRRRPHGFSLSVPTCTPARDFLKARGAHQMVLNHPIDEQIANAGEISRITAYLNRERENAIMGRYHAEQAADNKAQSAFCDSIGDLSRHKALDGSEIQTNSNAGDVWEDGHGNVSMGAIPTRPRAVAGRSSRRRAISTKDQSFPSISAGGPAFGPPGATFEKAHSESLEILMIHLLIPTLAPFSGEFTMHRASDPTTGQIAMRYLLPKGWKASDTVQWDPSNKMRPASVASAMSSPDGAMRISILPSETSMFGVQNGQLQGTLPPETATKALDHVLSSRHPGVQSAHLVVRKDIDVPTPFDGQEGLKTKGMVGILEVSFEENGQPTTELLSVTEYEGSHQEGGLTQGITMMTQGYTLTCKGPVTEAAYKTFAMVVASNRPDPTFFGTIMEVSKAQQSGTPDVKKVAAGVKGLPDDAKASYVQSLSLHGQSTAQIIPQTIYPGLTDVVTFDGSIMTFKGVHVWMRKPDEYFISESSNGPSGSGWQEAKAAS